MAVDRKALRDVRAGRGGPYLMAVPLSFGMWPAISTTLRECVRGAAAHTSGRPLSLGIWLATKRPRDYVRGVGPILLAVFYRLAHLHGC